MIPRWLSGVSERNGSLHISAHRRLVQNFFSLGALQALNYILPLLTLPYLMRVLGANRFGLIAFAQSFVMYFNILTDYGFNLSATRQIAKYRKDRAKVNEVFTSVMIVKAGLLFVSLFVMLTAVALVTKFRSEYFVYYAAFGIVIGQAMFPVWFFQGIERMGFITVINITAKLIFTGLVFLFIRKPSQYAYVPLVNSFGFITAGALGLWIASKSFGVRISRPSIKQLKDQLKDGWYIFLSTVGVNIYKVDSTVILGLFASDALVGYFYFARRLVDAASQLASIASQALYPFISSKIDDGAMEIRKVLWVSVIILAGYGLIVGIGFILFAGPLTSVLTGHPYNETQLSLRIMAFVPLVIGLNVPAVLLLLGAKKDKAFSTVVVVGALLDLLLNLVLVPRFLYLGSCFSVVFTETFITIGLYAVAVKNHLSKYLLAPAR